MTNSRDKMLRTVQQYSFAVLESAMYLDSHPDCAEALAYYNKYKKLCREAKSAFEEKYGPLTVNSDMNNESWQWVKAPWPWELSANEGA